MLILLKQLSVHHGDPGLSALGASLHPLAEDGSMPFGTLNPPERKGGSASDWTPSHASSLRGSPWVDLEHSEMLPSCGTFRTEQGAPWPAPPINQPLEDSS